MSSRSTDSFIDRYQTLERRLANWEEVACMGLDKVTRLRGQSGVTRTLQALHDLAQEEREE